MTANSNPEATTTISTVMQNDRADVRSSWGALPLFARAAHADTMMRQARPFVKAYETMNVEVVACDLFVTRNHLKSRVEANLLSPNSKTHAATFKLHVTSTLVPIEHPRR